jgi:hypothetical protein
VIDSVIITVDGSVAIDACSVVDDAPAVDVIATRDQCI